MSDPIDRQSVIGYIDRVATTGMGKKQSLKYIRLYIEKLPSTQPEIIHCKDCKNSEHWYRDRRRCFLWSEDGVSVFDDGFCNYAERRADG